MVKIGHNIRDTIKEFDANLFNLFQVKIKYCSAINHERLKIKRLRKIVIENDLRKKQTKLHE